MKASSKARNSARLYLLLMVMALLIGAALRLLAIRAAPPGPRFDETYDALLARRILGGERPLYFRENFGQEALNTYVQAASLAAFGWSDMALRFPSIAFGLLEIATIYALGRRAWNRRAGLLAAALCAVSFWAVFFSRLGLRLMILPALVSLGVLMLFEMHTGRAGSKTWLRASAAGILFGLAIHTYTAARALPLFLICALIYLALFRREELNKHLVGWGLVLVITILIAMPLAYFLATQPQAEARVGQVSGPLDALRQGNILPLIQYALAAAGMFVVRGGTEWLYNVPGRPLLDPLTALVFLVGLVIAIKRWWSSRTAFVLFWLLAGLMPILLSWPPASTSHAILAQPAVYLLIGLGLDASLSFVGQTARWASWKPALLVALLVMALNLALTVRDYFFVWNTSDSIRWEHQATVTAIGRYADAHPELREVALLGNAIDYYSPWMKVGNSLTSHRTDVRWLNPARALVWNPAGPMTYLLPYRDPNPVTFNQSVTDMFSVARQTLDQKLPDGRPVFTAYTIADASALHAQAMASATSPHDFGGRLSLIGYEVRSSPARPGDAVRLLTYWRVARADSAPLVMFVHLIDPDGKIVTQEDRLDVALETLHPGDEFMQTHRVTLPGNAQPGEYGMAFGLYSPVTNVRVPVAGSDRVEIGLVVR